eukprot:gene6161-10168_t
MNIFENFISLFQTKPPVEIRILEVSWLLSEAVNNENSIQFLKQKKITAPFEFHEIKVSKENKKTKFMICINKKEKKIFISFKGNLTIAELLKDINYFNTANETFGSIHAGILELSSEYPLRYFQLLLDDEYDLYFTGYSLGASIACLCCSKLFFLKNMTKEKQKRLYFLGFGAPLFVDEQFSKLMKEKISDSQFYFFQNEGDIIPYIISYLNYYQHENEQIDDKFLELHYSSFYFQQIEDDKIKKEFNEILEYVQVFLVKNWSNCIIDSTFPHYGTFGKYYFISESEIMMKPIEKLPSKNEIDWGFDLKHSLNNYSRAVDKQINPMKKPKEFNFKIEESGKVLIPISLEKGLLFGKDIICQSIHFDNEIKIILKLKPKPALYFKSLEVKNCKIIDEFVENQIDTFDEIACQFKFSIDVLKDDLEVLFEGAFSQVFMKIPKKEIIEYEELLGRRRKIAELTLPDLHLYSFSYSLFNEKYNFGKESSSRRTVCLDTLSQIAEFYSIKENEILPQDLVERVNQMNKELNIQEGKYNSNSQLIVKDLKKIYQNFQSKKQYSYYQAIKDSFPTLALFELKAGKEEIKLDYNSFEKGLIALSITGTLLILTISPIALIAGGIASLTLFSGAIGMGSLSLLSNVILTYKLKTTIDNEYFNRLQLIALGLGIETKPMTCMYEKEISIYYNNNLRTEKEDDIIKNWGKFFNKEPLSLTLDKSSKKYVLNCIKHIDQNNQLRENLIQDFSIGIIGSGKTGKSTLAKRMYPDYNTNPSQNNRTTDLDIFPFPISENASLVDFPHLTSLDKNYIASFYAYYKMLDAVVLIFRSDQNLDSEDDYNIIKYVLQIYQLDVLNDKLPIDFLICLNKFDEQINSCFKEQHQKFEYNNEEEIKKLISLADNHRIKSLNTLLKKLRKDNFPISKKLIQKLRSNIWLTSFEIQNDLPFCKQFKKVDDMFLEIPGSGKKSTIIEYQKIGVQSVDDVKNWIDSFISKNNF